MADEPSKEFEIKVTFSNVEQAIMGEFKKQIDDVAKAINVLAETMTGQIEALKLIQSDIKAYTAVASLGGGGFGGGGPVAPATLAGGHSNGGVGEIVAAIQDLSRNMERASGGGYGYSRSASLSGRLGNLPGERNWDQENSFENPQYGNFTFQDVLRQGASYLRTRKMGIHTTDDVEARHRARNEARQAYIESDDYDGGEIPDEYKNDNDFIHASTQGKRGPFSNTRGRIEGMSSYMRSLELPTSNLGDFLDKSQAIAPYFSQGGVFNPGTYGLGLHGLQQKAAVAGNIGRFGMQFGGDARMTPWGDSGSQFFGAKWDELRNTWGGLNPFLSGKQASEITGAVAGMGYSHGTAGNMRDMMSDVTQHTNIGISDQAAIIDKSFRWGYASLKQVADFMKNDMPAAAQAARMNMGQFSQQLVQVATGLQQSTGVDFFTSARQVTALTSGTGMDPGKAQTMLGNSSLTWLGASMAAGASGTGIQIGAFAYGSTRASGTAKATAARVKMLLLKTPDEIVELLKRPANDPELMALQSRFFMMQSQMKGMGIETLQDIGRLTDAGIHRTAITEAAGEFSSEATTQGDTAVAKAQSKLDKIDNPLLRGAMEATIRANAIDHFGNNVKGGRAALVKSVKAMAETDGWDQSDIFSVLGHHTVVTGMQGGHKQTKEVAGDINRSQKSIADALAKRIAEKTRDANEAASKNPKVNFTLSAGPSLAGLIQATVGSGNSAYPQGGGGQPAPPASPNTVIASGSTGP